jgi:hypothetical protein
MRGAALLLGVLLASCGRPPAPPVASTPAAASSSSTAKPAGVDGLLVEARALAPITTSPLGRRFLAATIHLPHEATRTLYRDAAHEHYWTATQAAALPASERAGLTSVEIDEDTYYETKYGSPLSYVRPLDVLEAHGVSLKAGDRVLDFGYGYVGHLRLLAALGLNVTGVDVDPLLPVLYSQPGDQGAIQGDGVTGMLRLVDGAFPKDPAIVQSVGAGYALVISKNVLKRGYIHPERPADPKHLVHLGVPDDLVLAAFFAALAPGGAMLVYNVCPAPSPPDKPFVPWSDGRSPFSRDQWTAAGFEIVAFDVDDTEAVRTMGRALGWDEDPDDPMDLERDLSVLYTLVTKPRR